MIDQYFKDEARDFEFRIHVDPFNAFKRKNFAPFRVHKRLLQMLNPYFDELLTTGTWSRRNYVCLYKTKVPVFERIIDFLYTGECILSSRDVGDIFQFAMKYHMDELIDECLTFMCGTISIFNCIDYLEIALEYDFENLRRECLQCIRFRPMKVLDLDQSKNCSPEAYADILEAIPRHLHKDGVVFDHAILWARNRLSLFQSSNQQNNAQVRQVLSPFLNHTTFVHLTYADFILRYERHQQFFTAFEFMTICTYLRERRVMAERRAIRRGRAPEIINDGEFYTHHDQDDPPVFYDPERENYSY